MDTPTIFKVADSSSVKNDKDYSEGHSRHYSTVFNTIQQRMIELEEQMLILKHEIDVIKPNSE